MIEKIEGLPTGVIGFEAVGRVHADDYATILVPAVDAAAAVGDIRLVYVLGEHFDGYTVGADVADARLGLSHLSAWKRGAIVTDHQGFRDLVAMFAWMVPGQVKLFHLADRDAAVEWVAQD